jgi:hypothetical protein
MPRKLNPDMITTNVRLPKKLHKNLEAEARRLGVSLNSEVVYRLEKSFRQASAEQLSALLRVLARTVPQIMENKKAKEIVEALEEAALQGDAIEDLERR